MPLFVDEEGRTYYSVSCLNPVTGRQLFPIHFNRAKGESPVDRKPLLHLPPDTFQRMVQWSMLLAFLNALLLMASIIGWWSGVPYSHFGGLIGLMLTGVFQFLVLPGMGQIVPFNRPVRYWGGQPLEPLLLELTSRLGFVFFFLSMMADQQAQDLLIPLSFAGALLLLPVWQVVRRLFAPDRHGTLMVP